MRGNALQALVLIQYIICINLLKNILHMQLHKQTLCEKNFLEIRNAIPFKVSDMQNSTTIYGHSSIQCTATIFKWSYEIFVNLIKQRNAIYVAYRYSAFKYFYCKRKRQTATIDFLVAKFVQSLYHKLGFSGFLCRPHITGDCPHQLLCNI